MEIIRRPNVFIIFQIVWLVGKSVADPDTADAGVMPGEFADERFHPYWKIEPTCIVCNWADHKDDCLNPDPNVLVAYAQECGKTLGHKNVFDDHACMVFIPKEPRVDGQNWSFRRSCVNVTHMIEMMYDPPEKDPSITPTYSWKAQGYLTHFEVNDCLPEDAVPPSQCDPTAQQSKHAGTAFICQMPKCNGIPLLNISYDPNYNKTGKQPSVNYYLQTQYNVTLPPLPYIPTRPPTSAPTTTPADAMTTTTSESTTTSETTTTPTTTTKPITVRTAPTKSTPTTPTSEPPKVTQSPAEATTSAAIHSRHQFWAYSICFSSIILSWGQNKKWL